MSYSSYTNKTDGVVAEAEDNKDPIGTDPDAAEDAAESRQNIDPVGGIRAGTPNPYKGPGNTSLTPGDPRFT